MSLVQSLNLREKLISNPDPNPPRPLAYHDRTQHLLPAKSCELQDQLDRLVEYSQRCQMQINVRKSKVMIFNTGRKYDVMPQLTLSDMGGNFLEVVENHITVIFVI